MKMLKLLSTCISLAMLATLSGCSGGNSASTASSANQKKALAKSLASDLQITSDTLDQGQPSTAYDNISNKYLTVWTHTNEDGTTDIKGRLFGGSGGTGTEFPTTFSIYSTAKNSKNIQIDISSATGNQSQPRVAFDPEYSNVGRTVNGVQMKNGRYLVVWTDTRSGIYSQIYGRFIDPAGTPDNGKGEFAVSSHRTSTSSYIITTGTIDVTNGSAVITGTGTTFTTDDVQSGDVIDILGERFTVLSKASDTSLTLTKNYTGVTRTGVSFGIYKSISTNQSDPDILYNPVSKKFVVAWSDLTNADSTETLYNGLAFGSYSTSLGKVSGLTGPYIRGATCKNATAAIYGAVPLPVIDNNMVRSVEIFKNVSSVNPQNYSQIASTSGLMDDGSSTITKTWSLQNGESKPRITISPITGEYFIAWSGKRVTGSLTITYKANNGDCNYNSVFSGTPVDTEQKIIIRKNTGLGLLQDYIFGSKAFSPVLATDPNTNRLLVAWEEQSATSKSIQGQMVDLVNFASYGTQINISSGTGDRSAPVASFDNVNQRFLVVWEDARNGSANISNMDIYGQFIDPQGNLSGGNTIISVASGNQLAPSVVFGGPLFRQFLVVWKDGRSGGNADIYGQLLEWSSLPQLVVADDKGNPIYTGALDFGNVTTGKSKDIAIKVRNDGNSPLVISQPVSTPDAPFSFVTPPPTTINPGTAYDMTIRFSPVAAGAYATSAGKNYQMTLNSNGGQAVLYFSGAGVGINELTITTSTLSDILPTVAVDTAIATLSGSGGVAPYTWSATLPAGLAATQLSLNASTGVLTQKAGGAAIVAGVYNISFTVTDSNTPAVSASRTLTLNVGSIGITTTQLSTWTQNSPTYSYTLQSTGTTGTRTWSTPGVGTVGSLPAGLSLAAGTGVISGTPTVSGSFSVSVILFDAGTGSTVSKSIPVTINPTPSIITSSLAAGVVAQTYTQALTMAGGTLPITWSLNGSLPPGLTFNTGTGVITGTPTADGTYPFNVTVTDATQATVTKTLQIVISKVLDITTTTTLPSAISAQAYSTTLSGAGGTLPYTWSALNLPTGFALNPFTGLLTATPSITGTFSFVATLTDASASSVSRTFTITINLPVAVSTASLNAWTVNRPGYSQTLTATGGNGVYTWVVSSGTLPPGLALAPASGVISGIPTTSGNYSFTVSATDSSTLLLSGSKQLTIMVNPALNVTTTALGSGVVNTLYSQQLLSSGGTTPVLWSANAALPAGLTLDNLTGIVSGIPTAAGTSAAITFTATDAAGSTALMTTTISISAAPVVKSLAIDTLTLPAAQISADYNQTILASGGTVPYTWSVSAGALPTGLTLDANTGVIAGKPTTAGIYNFVLKVTDTKNNTASQTLSMSVSTTPAGSTLAITPIALPLAPLNAAYSQTISVTGGTAPYNWSISSGSLPTGLTLGAATGVISGTPTASGVYSFVVTATDAKSASAALTLSISTIQPSTGSLTITTSALLPATTENPFSANLTVSGGAVPYTWSLAGGTALPTGLVLSNSGSITGSPTVSGSYDFMVQVQDANKNSTTRMLSLTVNQKPKIVSSSIKPWTLNTGGYNAQLTAIGGSAPYKWEWGVDYPEAQISPTTGQVIGTVWKPGNPAPAGMVLDTTTGKISGTPAAVTSGYSFWVRVTDSNGGTDYGQISNFVVNSSITITSTILSSATPGNIYQDSIKMSGGTAPFAWTLQSGVLPAGLTLDPVTGTVSGIPTAAATTNQFTIKVTDSTGAATTQALSIAVSQQLAVSATSPLPSVSLNTSYNQLLTATGGREPYAWSVASGALPDGLTLASATGVIRGTATAAGKFTFVAKVTDADARTATQTLSITVGSATTAAALSITTTSLPAGEMNKAYTTTTLAATGGTIPRSWTLVGGSLPTGLTLASATGVISGTPTAAGNYDLIFQVTDADLKSTTQTLSIVVLDPSVSGGLVQFTDGTSRIISLAYGNVYKGTSTNKTVTIKNSSSTAIAISSVSSDSSAFSFSGAPFSVASNGTATFDVTFTPSQVKAYSGVITLSDTSGSTYKLTVSGSGIGANVVLQGGTGTVSYFNTIAPSALPTQGKPTDFLTQSAADFQITGVTPGSTVSVSVTFANMPAIPVFYKLDSNSNWIALSGATVSGNTVTFDVADNGPLDTNPTAGIIRDPIIVGSNFSASAPTNIPPATSGGGGSGGGGCFIATAAYGSYLDPHVMTLRHFRDNVLLQSELGRDFVIFYYKHSPPIADFIAEHDTLRIVMRLALTPLIFAVKYPLAAAILIVLVGAWLIRRKGLHLRSI